MHIARIHDIALGIAKSRVRVSYRYSAHLGDGEGVVVEIAGMTTSIEDAVYNAVRRSDLVPGGIPLIVTLMEATQPSCCVCDEDFREHVEAGGSIEWATLTRPNAKSLHFCESCIKDVVVMHDYGEWDHVSDMD